MAAIQAKQGRRYAIGWRIGSDAVCYSRGGKRFAEIDSAREAMIRDVQLFERGHKHGVLFHCIVDVTTRQVVEVAPGSLHVLVGEVASAVGKIATAVELGEQV